MCLIGYSKNPKGYKLIDLSTKKVVTRSIHSSLDIELLVVIFVVALLVEVHLQLSHFQTLLTTQVGLTHFHRLFV